MPEPMKDGVAALRYELTFLVGPCSEEEATELLEELFEAINGRLGAVGSLHIFEENE